MLQLPHAGTQFSRVAAWRPRGPSGHFAKRGHGARREDRLDRGNTPRRNGDGELRGFNRVNGGPVTVRKFEPQLDCR